MKFRKSNQDDQEKSNSEIERRSPSEVDPLSNNEIPEVPDEYGTRNDEDQVIKEDYSEY